MYEYIKGSLTDAAPTYAVVECGGIGYYVNISVNTYAQISQAKEVMLFLHQIVREDAHLLYGFASKEERTLFRQLISVSALVMLGFVKAQASKVVDKIAASGEVTSVEQLIKLALKQL